MEKIKKSLDLLCYYVTLINFYIYVNVLSTLSIEWVSHISENIIDISWLELDFNLNLVLFSTLVFTFAFYFFFEVETLGKVYKFVFLIAAFYYCMLSIEVWVYIKCLKWIYFEHYPNIIDPLRDVFAFNTNLYYVARYIVSQLPYMAIGSIQKWIDLFSYVCSFVLISFFLSRVIKRIMLWTAAFFRLEKEVWKKYFLIMVMLHFFGKIIYLWPVFFLITCSLSKDLACLILEYSGEPMAFLMPIWHFLFIFPLILKVYIFILRAKSVNKGVFYTLMILLLTLVVSLDIVIGKTLLIESLMFFLENPEVGWGQATRPKPFGLFSSIFWLIINYVF